MPSAASMLASPGGVSGTERLPDNINPNINVQCVGKRIVTPEELDENYRDAFDEREIFDMIRYAVINNILGIIVAPLKLGNWKFC